MGGNISAGGLTTRSGPSHATRRFASHCSRPAGCTGASTVGRRFTTPTRATPASASTRCICRRHRCRREGKWSSRFSGLRRIAGRARIIPSRWRRGERRPGLKLVHEGKIAPLYISLIALLAHPASPRVTISEHPRVDMRLAEFAVLVTPPGRKQSSPRADRQSLVRRRIVSALTPTYTGWFQFCPDPYLAIPYD